ncbi:MAG: MFS transporter [Nitrososphaeria archaeon]|nr:MFS transporter [Nitrososphaeria archaeon]
MASRKKAPSRLSYYFKLRIDRKSFAVILISVAGYLVWLMAFPMFGPITASFLDGLKALDIEKGRFVQWFLISMVVSSLVGGYLIDKAKRRVLFIWISALIASLLTFAFIWLNRVGEVFLFSLLLGFVSGLSPVAWGAYFADHTSPEDRGRVMGMSVGLSMPIAYLFLIAEPFGGTSEAKIMVIGSVLLITLVTLTLRPQEKTEEILSSKGRRGPGAKQIVFYASPIFLFYLVAGILLSIVFPTVQDHVRNEIFYLIWAIPFLMGAIVAGIMFDSRGRKFPTIVGLAITGVSLAVFGIIGIRLGYVSIISLAIGFSFVTTLSFIIWADLAPARARGIYYGAGVGLMAAALMLGLISAGTIFGSVSASRITGYMLFSSVALFLCIPPLIVAEETLPKELIEKRQLQEYLDEVKRKFVKK